MKKYTVVFLALFSLLAFAAWLNRGKAPSDQGFTAGPQHVPSSVYAHGIHDVEPAAMKQIGAKFNRDMEVQLAIYTLSQH